MEDLAQRFLAAVAAFASGDLIAVQEAFSPSVRTVWGGNSAYAGNYTGVGAAIALLAHSKEWFDPGSISIESMTPTDDGLVIVETVTMRDLGSGDRVEGVRFRLTVTFDENGQIDFIENMPEDPDAVDGFLNREHKRRNPGT